MNSLKHGAIAALVLVGIAGGTAVDAQRYHRDHHRHHPRCHVEHRHHHAVRVCR